MKTGDRVVVQGGACDGMMGDVVLRNGAATLVGFARPVHRRNGMLSEEVWIRTKQLRPASDPATSTSGAC